MPLLPPAMTRPQIHCSSQINDVMKETSPWGLNESGSGGWGTVVRLHDSLGISLHHNQNKKSAVRLGALPSCGGGQGASWWGRPGSSMTASAE